MLVLPTCQTSILIHLAILLTGNEADVSKLKQNDESLRKKNRKFNKVLSRLENSKNIHETKAVRKGDAGKLYLDGEITTKKELAEVISAANGNGVVVDESTKAELEAQEFKKDYNFDDTRQSDGTGVGSTMYLGVDALSESKELEYHIHERLHQYNADRGKISVKVKKMVNEEKK